MRGTTIAYDYFTTTRAFSWHDFFKVRVISMRSTTLLASLTRTLPRLRVALILRCEVEGTDVG